MARLEIPQSRDISVAISFGQISIALNAEGVSYNPTVARDMQDRVMSMLKDALVEASAHGLLITANEVVFDDGSGQYDEDEDGE